MSTLQLKPSYKVVQAYYDEINKLGELDIFTEVSVSPAFASLLRYSARQFEWTLVEQFRMRRNGKSIRVDGALLDKFKLVHGVWEAKDSKHDLAAAIKQKFAAGYPKDNILFQAPDHIILWQDGQCVFDDDVSKPEQLVEAVKLFFEYEPPAFEQWQRAVEEFKVKVPELAAALLELIEKERRTNKQFVRAFADFTELCKSAINPNLSIQAVEEMLIQHLLTERIFRKVFDNPDFVERNIVAREIEKVIQALTSHYFSRHEFLKKLDRFYGAIEATAATIDDYSQKQAFLNTVYENFFQGFSVKIADTHGIVYTPQPVVNFMVKSVEDILQKEFGRSLSDKGVHILDPFVGTGNFIIRIMREIKKTALPYKYRNELHCNEVMLLPYYIASMNIEHAYYELTNDYKTFDGICLVDTFELAEERQTSLFTTENTERVDRQKETPIFVIIANPPYNAGQVNENDNNKSRKYPVIDKRVAETYVRDSKATNKNALSDVYVKAIRWASDRITQSGEGIVSFVSRNSFIDEIAFDGARKHLGQDFDSIYVLDLGGNVRKNPKLSGTTHNVFGIQVGVSISLFVKKKSPVKKRRGDIYYARIDEFWRKEQKYDFLDETENHGGVDWREIKPDSNNTWLTEELQDDFGAFLPLGTKEVKARDGEAIFKIFSNGVKTNRDAWAYNFSPDEVSRNICRTIETYNEHVLKWTQISPRPRVDDFVLKDDATIAWSRDLKLDLQREKYAEFAKSKIRHALYRPFIKESLYFDKVLNEEVYQFHHILPSLQCEMENRVICVNRTTEKPFSCLATDMIPDLVMTGGFGSPTQCFPLYTYEEDGSTRRDNITLWAMVQFKQHYKDESITELDIFYYVYGILHYPQYREKYAANLRRELPRIPFAPDFRGFAGAGERLAELHVNYEEQEEYPLEMVENEEVPLDWRVEKMKLSKDRTQIIYNDFLTLAGIPAKVFEYRLGNRSALEWIVDQYRIKTDKRSGIVNDPYRPDDPQYIVRLIKKVVTVSLETVKIVEGLPELEG
jgi:predicted helicase